MRLFGMSLFWIGIAATGPTSLAFLAAWPLWARAKEVIVGNVVGALIVTASVFALISREYIEAERVRRRCEELTGAICAGDSAGTFTKFAVYAFIGLAEIVALFAVGEVIDHRRRRRDYAPEWR